MTHKVKKLILYRVPSPILDRWDADIRYDDGTSERKVDISIGDVAEILLGSMPKVAR